MNDFVYVIFGFLFLIVIFKMIPAKGVRNISIVQLKEELKEKKKQFIDVRTPGEFEGKHIEGFKNIPLHQLEEKSESLSKEKEIVLICQSGVRSQRAAKILKKLGFTKITNVRGGLSAWRN